MRYILIHYHIFKNAGSTVESILDKSFGECWTRFDDADPNRVLRGDDLLAMLERNPKILSLSSHQLRHPVPEVDDYAFFDLIFLRDPIDRLYSMYRHFRRVPPSADLLSALAGMGLKHFVSELVNGHPHYVNDVQVNMLANGGDYIHPPGQWDLDAATKIMQKAGALGVVDCFNVSWIAAQYFLRPAFPTLDCRYVAHNTSPEWDQTMEQRIANVSNACGKHLFEELLRLNQLDIELVRRARAEVNRRFDLVPGRYQRLSELEQQLADLESAASHAAVPSDGQSASARAGSGSR